MLKFLAGVGLIAFLVTSASLSAPSYAEEAPVVIGFAMGLSSAFGQQNQRGLDLAVKQINESGGVLGGRKVKVVAYDDQNKPDQTISVINRLINSDRAIVIIGPLTTTATEAAMPVIKRAGVVEIAAAGKTPSLRDHGGPMIFFLNSTVAMDAAPFDSYVENTLKLKRIAVMAEQSDYGQANVNLILNDWSGADAPKIISTDRFAATDTDFTPVLTRIRGENPDGLYITTGALETFATIVRQARELGIKAPILPGPGAIAPAALVKLIGKLSDGLVWSDFYSNLIDTPENNKFVADFMKTYNYRPDKMELTGYEAGLLSAGAIDKAGPGASEEKIADTLRDTVWSTPRGKWKFEKLGVSYQAPAPTILLTLKDGQVGVVH